MATKKKKRQSFDLPLFYLAFPRRFERPTYRLGGLGRSLDSVLNIYKMRILDNFHDIIHKIKYAILDKIRGATKTWCTKSGAKNGAIFQSKKSKFTDQLLIV